MVTGQTICLMSQETQTCSVVPLTLILTAKVFFVKSVLYFYTPWKHLKSSLLSLSDVNT